ncbi:hypothetical protein LSAT2_024553 [Lamellibrachia satsuma]|nr:hypothetical protein LSAT2_024553 [Lamellibrachia satsuma]
MSVVVDHWSSWGSSELCVDHLSSTEIEAAKQTLYECDVVKKLGLQQGRHRQGQQDNLQSRADRVEASSLGRSLLSSTMTHFKSVILAACVALSLKGNADAVREITCLSFEKNCKGSRGVWVSQRYIQRVSADCPSGEMCARFRQLQLPYSSRLSIPRFAESFNAWSGFTLSFWFKTADDKTSLLFHNDLCRDNGSFTVTVYNSGMLIVEQVLDNKKNAMTIAFVSRNDWHHVAVVWTGRDVKMYADGECQDTSPLTGGRIYNSRCPLVVAGHPKKASDDVFPFEGYMDQICMYGTGLNAMQVKDLFENPHP